MSGGSLTAVQTATLAWIKSKTFWAISMVTQSNRSSSNVCGRIGMPRPWPLSRFPKERKGHNLALPRQSIGLRGWSDRLSCAFLSAILSKKAAIIRCQTISWCKAAINASSMEAFLSMSLKISLQAGFARRWDQTMESQHIVHPGRRLLENKLVEW